YPLGKIEGALARHQKRVPMLQQRLKDLQGLPDLIAKQQGVEEINHIVADTQSDLTAEQAAVDEMSRLAAYVAGNPAFTNEYPSGKIQGALAEHQKRI